MRTARIGLVLLAAAQLTCHQALLVAPPGSTITLFANPTFIASNGGISIISALVIEPAGTPAPDGTVVQFFTNLGRIDEQGRTNDGVARVNLVADGRSGVASVSGFSGGQAAGGAPSTSGTPSPFPTPPVGTTGGGSSSGAVSVAIGNVNAVNMILTADPSRLTISRASRITATLYDSAGNPVSGAPVVFTVDDNPATEFMDGQGRPIFTDNNGQAEDIMRTRRNNSGTATVKAVAPGGSGALLEATVDVAIVF